MFDVELINYANESVQVSITNIFGQIVEQKSITQVNSNHEMLGFNLEGMAAGTYIVTLVSKSGSVVRKVVVE